MDRGRDGYGAARAPALLLPPRQVTPQETYWSFIKSPTGPSYPAVIPIILLLLCHHSRCNDGSQANYYTDPGLPQGKVLITLQGGGKCDSIQVPEPELDMSLSSVISPLFRVVITGVCLPPPSCALRRMSPMSRLIWRTLCFVEESTPGR